MMFRDPKTNTLLAALIDQLIENESPGLYDEAVEILHNELKRNCCIAYDSSIAELMQCEVNHKIFTDSIYRYSNG